MKENILVIETSGVECSVVICRGGKIIKEVKTENSGESINSAEHSRLLATFIEEAKSALSEDEKIDAVAVNYGPGSYTGLRIGLAMAKGICFASGAKLLVIDALRPMVDEALKLYENKIKSTENSILMPMIDARRMEIYTAEYNADGEQMSEIGAVVVDENTFKRLDGKVYIFGNGAAKIEETMKNSGVDVELFDVKWSAASMAKKATELYEVGNFQDIAYTEPLYIKEWQPQASYYKKLKK